MKKIIILVVMLYATKFTTAQNVGIGTPSPAQKLDVVGNLKVSGAIMPAGVAGTAGQVLTSAGAGAAPTWVTPGGGKFYIMPSNNTRTGSSFTGRGGFIVDGATNPSSQNDSLDYGTTNETGTDFTISNPGLTNNFITVNRTGLYHFEGVLRLFITSNISVDLLSRATVSFVAQSSPTLNILLIEDPMYQTGGSVTSSSTNQYNYTAKFQFNIHLTAASTCTFITGFNLLRFPGGTDLIGLGVSSGGYISGHFVSE